MNILSINAGSSSIKYKAYSLSNKKHKLLLGGLMEGIGEPLGKWHHHFKKVQWKNISLATTQRLSPYYLPA